MGLDERVDFLQESQILKTFNFRWKASSKAWIASYGSASSKKKAIPLAQADLQNIMHGNGPRCGCSRKGLE